MQIQRVMLLLLALTSVVARRVQKKRASERSSLTVERKSTCHITENAHSLKYGIKGSWQVPNCMMCKFHTFLTTTMPLDVISGAEPSEDGADCKCYTSPKFWEAHGLDKKFWFQYDAHRRSCSQAGCRETFSTWANMFNRKTWTVKYNKGEGDRMPVDLFIESQEGYDLHCDDSMPEGLTLPSPASKILQLRLQIEQCTDPEEKLRLEAMLAELLADKEIEVWDYRLDEEWSPTEHETDASADGEHHTFFLKPCKSQKDREVTELTEIFELCGPGELGVTMKGGELRVSYVVDDPWGPEMACKPADEECQILQNIAADEGVVGEILSFRLRPCKSPSGTAIDELSDVLKSGKGGCGPPSTHKDADGFATFLPVKMDISSHYDEAAPEDDGLKYPC